MAKGLWTQLPWLDLPPLLGRRLTCQLDPGTQVKKVETSTRFPMKLQCDPPRSSKLENVVSASMLAPMTLTSLHSRIATLELQAPASSRPRTTFELAPSSNSRWALALWILQLRIWLK